MAGKRPEMHVPQEDLLPLCKVIDYWISKDNSELIGRLGLGPLANEVKRDYVTASLLAWRGEFKMAYISLRSFIESFCILLYYLNQGCDRLLYLKGQGYKLMLHRMAQKRNVEDEPRLGDIIGFCLAREPTRITRISFSRRWRAATAFSARRYTASFRLAQQIRLLITLMRLAECCGSVIRSPFMILCLTRRMKISKQPWVLL